MGDDIAGDYQIGGGDAVSAPDKHSPLGHATDHIVPLRWIEQAFRRPVRALLFLVGLGALAAVVGIWLAELSDYITRVK
jgi:hypothetical protein